MEFYSNEIELFFFALTERLGYVDARNGVPGSVIVLRFLPKRAYHRLGKSLVRVLV